MPKIEFNKKQYKGLIKYVEIASAILGILGDFIGKKYKKEYKELEELRDYLLKHAEDFRCNKIIEEFEGEIILKEKFFEKYAKIIDDYDDYVFWNELAHRLARRDFFKKHTKKDYRKMNIGERIVKIGEIEDKYWEEFEKYGIERVEIK